MQILEAYDLTQSLRGAAELAGVSHHTVAHWVARRDAGELSAPGEAVRRERAIDPYLPKVEEWVERSAAKVRADVVFKRLRRVGFLGSERTVRRAVAEGKQAFRSGRHRVYRPWLPEPGMWAQWDWGQGPLVGTRRANLFCAWLAWCRHRVVLPTWDRTLPTVIACLDRSMRCRGPKAHPGRSRDAAASGLARTKAESRNRGMPVPAASLWRAEPSLQFVAAIKQRLGGTHGADRRARPCTAQGSDRRPRAQA